MRIPKTVKIGAYIYKIIHKSKVTHKGVSLTGLCDNDSFEIVLEKGLSGAELMVVFMHECLHAIEYCHEIKLGENKVKRLDHAIVAFLTDNNLRFNG